MARLTWTKEDGTWGVTGIDFNLEKLNPLMYGALSKLKDYEEVCDSPDKLREIDNLYREKCEEVNKLKVEMEELKQKPFPDTDVAMAMLMGEALLDIQNVLTDVNEKCKELMKAEQEESKGAKRK